MPGLLRCTCGDYARVLHLISHARLRVQRAPGIPCALCFPGEWFCKNSGASRRGIAEVCREYERATFPAVIARHRVGAERRPMTGSSRAIQYSRGGRDGIEKPRRTGYPACAGYDGTFEFKNSKWSKIIAFPVFSN